jgi:uncharacterized protein YuzB (UPF0349 family)
MTECIEACVSNVDHQTRSQLSDADVSTSVYPCLEHCGRCYREPFLVVDGELVTGESHGALLAEVLDR